MGNDDDARLGIERLFRQFEIATQVDHRDDLAAQIDDTQHDVRRTGYRFDRQRPQHFMNLQDWHTVFLRAEAKADPTRKLAIALAGQRAHGNAAADTEAGAPASVANVLARSEEHTSELQSLMRHSYAV